VFEGVEGGRCTDCEGIEFQMTGADVRKKRMEWGQESAGQRSEENGLIDDNECASEILRRVCAKGFICNGGKFETYSAVNR